LETKQRDRGRAYSARAAPKAVWYRIHNEADVDTIIAEHVQGGTIVERLRV
jgi:(2Fe-2S) ferredoxin